MSDNDFQLSGELLTTEVASVSTREMQEVESIANDYFLKVDFPEAYRIDAKPYIERPFYAGKVDFSVSSPRYSWLTSPINFLPGDIIRSNQSLLNAMKIGSLYRADLIMNLSMAGTITHAGCVIAAVLPPMPVLPTIVNNLWINTLLSSPHAFLYANEATSITLPVPWYCNSDVATLDMEQNGESTTDITPINGNYGTLVLCVLNPLTPSDGSSTSLSIIMEACFKNLDILVPTPRYVNWLPQSGLIDGLMTMTKKGLKRVTGDFIDNGLDIARAWTGLHNPVTSTINQRVIMNDRNFPNTVDAEQFFEKLDPFTQHTRVVQSPIFGTTVDEMSMSHIVSKKQMLGSFVVSTDDQVGKLYWIRPISPCQGGIINSPSDYLLSNNIELMHALSRGWRGGLKIHVVSVMNNKQQVKLKLIKMYNPSVKVMSSVPEYQSVANAPSHLMEFTQGGQELETTLPYLCRNDLTPCAEDLTLEALQHGVYYIYLAQPLANSDGSPTKIEFNVFMSGEPDLTFYGYTNRFLSTNGYPLYNPAVDQQDIWKAHEQRELLMGREFDAGEAEEEFSAQAGSSFRFSLLQCFWFGRRLDAVQEVEDELIYEADDMFEAQSGIRVMNEPQVQDENVDVDNKGANVQHVDRLIPNVDVRPYIRRMYKTALKQVIDLPGASVQTLVVPLAGYLGETRDASFSSPSFDTPISYISQMYYGKTAGFKMSIEVATLKDDSGLKGGAYDFQIFYVPPNFTTNANNETIVSAPVNPVLLDPSLAPDVYPTLPYQVTAVDEQAQTRIYEFTIPDVTFYKYMGSPIKFYSPNVVLSDQLSTNDFGSIYMRYNNRVGEAITLRTVVSVGLTDESRMGFHTLAPVIRVNKHRSPYLMYNQTTPPSIKSPSLYRGSFL